MSKKKKDDKLKSLAFTLDKQKQTDETLDDLRADLMALSKPLQAVIASQTAFPVEPSHETKQKRLEEFVKWLTSKAPNCFYGERFTFDLDAKEGTGVVAATNLALDQHFMSIPRSIMLSTDTYKQSPVGIALKGDQLLSNMPSLALAVHLAFERLDPSSFWKPYIDVLPQSFTLPLVFEESHLKLLEGSPTLRDVLKLQKSTIRQYLHVMAALQRTGAATRLPVCSFAIFQWAVAVVMTRQNRIPSGERSAMALIPAWDFCNHRCGKMATYYNPDDHVSESFTMEEVSKGQPIFLHYGNRPNSKLFLFSGFVADNNPYDIFEFDLPFSVEDPLVKIKRLLLSKLNLKLPLTLPVTDDVAKALRVMVLNKDEASLALKDCSTLENLLNTRNEKAAWELGKQIFTQLLSGYEGVDEEKLLESCSDARSSVALRVKLSEKRLLRQAIQGAESSLKMYIDSSSEAK